MVLERFFGKLLNLKYVPHKETLEREFEEAKKFGVEQIALVDYRTLDFINFHMILTPKTGRTYLTAYRLYMFMAGGSSSANTRSINPLVRYGYEPKLGILKKGIKPEKITSFTELIKEKFPKGLYLDELEKEIHAHLEIPAKRIDDLIEKNTPDEKTRKEIRKKAITKITARTHTGVV